LRAIRQGKPKPDLKAYPGPRLTSEDHTAVRCTPMRCTPMRYTPVRDTPVRYTSMRYRP